MSTANRTSTANPTGSAPPPTQSYYEQQRELLISEIAQSLEHVLQNINRLNRSLEEVVQVGNEFAPVESLWSHFENVMAKDEEGERESGQDKGGAEGGSEGETEV